MVASESAGRTTDRGGDGQTKSALAPTSHHDRVYFPGFDWLRFALACTVMFSHFGLFPAWPRAGDFAVQVFFALSGWLIGGILLDVKRRELPAFFFNRAVRIWAPYYLALIFLVTASLLRDPITLKWLEFVAYKATFTWNLFGTRQLGEFTNAMPLKGTGNHFWSVGAEEQFYLLAPVVLVLAAPRLGKNPITWMLLAATALVAELYAAIVLGVMAATIHRVRPGFHLNVAIRIALAALLLVCVAELAGGARYTLVAPVIALTIVLLLAVPGRKTALGGLAGGLSYPLYLNHWIGAFTATVVLIPFGLRHSPLQLVLATILNIGLAGVLFWWIDKPLLARRAQLFTAARGKLAIAIGYGQILTGTAFGVAMIVAAA